MRLTTRVPLWDDSDLDWPRFVSKASRGSYKAAEMVVQASHVLAVSIAGEQIIDEAPVAIFLETLASKVPVPCPFSDAQAFLNALFESGYLEARMVARQTPFAVRSDYDGLWKRQVSVRESQLVHDAVLACVARWERGVLPQLLDTIEADDSNYNSQDAVVAMLMIIIAS